jgi:hypothetical protein
MEKAARNTFGQPFLFLRIFRSIEEYYDNDKIRDKGRK